MGKVTMVRTPLSSHLIERITLPPNIRVQAGPLPLAGIVRVRVCEVCYCTRAS
jgi:hypothetical protein